MRRRVAFLARHGRVLFYQRISRLAVVELLERRFPVNKGKILAVVLEVAAHAVPAVGIFHSKKSVITLVRGETVRNFLMAFETFERRSAGSELMAGVALRRTVEGFVRFGEGAGRDLRAGTGSEEETAERQQRGEEPGRREAAETTPLCFCEERLHNLPPTSHSVRLHRGQPESKLARAFDRQTHEASSCVLLAKLD